MKEFLLSRPVLVKYKPNNMQQIKVVLEDKYSKMLTHVLTANSIHV